MNTYYFNVELHSDKRINPARLAKALRRVIENSLTSDIEGAEVLDEDILNFTVKAATVEVFND